MGIIKTLRLIICSVILFSIAIPATYSETFDEYQERMRREQEESRKNSENNQNNSSKDDNSSFSSCLSGLFRGKSSSSKEKDKGANDGNNKAPNTSGSSSDSSCTSSCCYMVGPVSSEISIMPAYIFGDGYTGFSVSALADFSFFIFNINLYDKFMMDSSLTRINTFAIHGGLSIPLDPVLVNIFVGIMIQEDYFTGFSFGTNIKVHLLPELIFTIYALGAFTDYAFIAIVTPTLNYRFDFISIGLGMDYNYFDGMVTYGPAFKIAVWLGDPSIK